MNGGTHVYVGYSLIMIDPLRQGYKNKGRVKIRGWNLIQGRKAREKKVRIERSVEDKEVQLKLQKD